MDEPRKKLLQEQTRVFKALAHPTRLFIVQEIAAKPRCVCELTEMVGHDVSTISKHLSVLKNAGVVTDSKEGTTVWYSLAMPCVLGFFGCIRNALESAAKERLTLVNTLKE
jgi:DNA-binding transcriptional ArsR family regulator